MTILLMMSFEVQTKNSEVDVGYEIECEFEDEIDSTNRATKKILAPE